MPARCNSFLTLFLPAHSNSGSDSGQDPFVYQASPQQSDEPSASPQITWATPVELIAGPK
jgi:hypothetical protein